FLVATHECAHDRDLEALRSFDHTSQVVVRGLPRGVVRVEVVRVIGEGRDLEAVPVQQAAHRLRVEILDVDVRYARVAAPLAPARRPACDLERLESVVVGPLRDLFEGEGGKRRRQQAEPHRTLAFTARSPSTQRRPRWPSHSSSGRSEFHAAADVEPSISKTSEFLRPGLTWDTVSAPRVSSS